MNIAIKKTSGTKRVLISIGVLTGITLAYLLFLAVWEAYEAHHTLKLFSDDLITQNYEGAYQLTSPEFQSVTDQSKFMNQQKTLCSRSGGLEKIEVISSDTEDHISGWSSDISAVFRCKNSDLDIDFALRKESGRWMIYGYATR